MQYEDLNNSVQSNSDGALVYTYNRIDERGYTVNSTVVLRQPVLCSYYDNSSTSKGPHMHDSCDTININIASGDTVFSYLDNSSTAQVVTNNYHVKYNTTVMTTESGTHTFILKCDGNCRMIFDGQHRIDLASTIETREVSNRFTVNLTANTYYPAYIEYDKYTGDSLLQLYWIRPGQEYEEIVPTDNLWFDHYYGGQRRQLNLTCPPGYTASYVGNELSCNKQ